MSVFLQFLCPFWQKFYLATLSYADIIDEAYCTESIQRVPKILQVCTFKCIIFVKDPILLLANQYTMHPEILTMLRH